MGLYALETGWMAFGLALLLLALALALKAAEWRRQSGLPAGNIIYTDTGTWYPQRDSLYAPALGLTGRPDYLVEQPNGVIIPVEVKSGVAPPDPYFGHVMQLAAYCKLVEAKFGVRPDHGIIQYRDKAFSVNFTEQMEYDLLDVLDAMRQDFPAEDVRRDHYNWRRCAGCGHRNHCEQRLA